MFFISVFFFTPLNRRLVDIGAGAADHLRTRTTTVTARRATHVVTLDRRMLEALDAQSARRTLARAGL